MRIPSYPWRNLLLHPQIPRPLWGLNPRTIWGADWWDGVRHEAYRKFNRQCWACGRKPRTPLEAHENYQFDYANGTAFFLGTVALCHYCHCFIHRGRLEMEWRAKRVTTAKRAAILAHGRKVLSGRESVPYRGKIAPLDRWTLVVATSAGTVRIRAISVIRRK
jgi:hypothetical protein